MSRRQLPSDRNLRLLADLFFRLPRQIQIGLIVLAVVGVIAYWLAHRPPTDSTFDTTPSGESAGAASGAGGPGSYLFCFWNVENLFDDREDRRNSIDRPYDEAFASNEALRTLKYDHLAAALVRMNGGAGPDVIACAEVESTRAGELLMAALNAKISDAGKKYRTVAMRDLNAGRHIAPCVITRLPVVKDETRLHGGNLRILEVHITANGSDLCVLATHWTSQIGRNGGHGEEGRDKYARAIHHAVADQTRQNSKADILVCGDFNTTPDDPEVVGTLKAVGDPARVISTAADPFLLDLMSGKPAEKYGTLWYGGKPLIYDHICVSAGLLDPAGWSCEPESVHTVSEGLTRPGATRRQPWRFGDPDRDTRLSDRGFSDHFPVTVRLNVR